MSETFLLVGNGPYCNRGCEAIVRGTMSILRREFGSDIKGWVGTYASAEEVREQNAAELDEQVSAFGLRASCKRWSTLWWAMQANQRLGAHFAAEHGPLQRPARLACVALEVGGDNYSLDYGIPDGFLNMDRFLQRQGIPVVLWGASVGPFEAEPGFAPGLFAHLRTLAAIFVRESESREYLKRNGVEQNVFQVADPAFVMEPVQPPTHKLGYALPAGAVGLNFSPLLARYFTGSPRQSKQATEMDLAPWLALCVDLVKAAVEVAQRPILLVPHVRAPIPENDDFSFLQAVQKRVASLVSQPVLCLPDGLNAAEIKWAIAQCAVFAGARTHSTIAAVSAGVPTLSLGYSLKARGLNRDLFGNLEYCLQVSELCVATFRERLGRLLAQGGALREWLSKRSPELQAAAFQAGPLLRKVLALRPAANVKA
jgi:colanic acid/amylovoran biosynthesis protein